MAPSVLRLAQMLFSVARLLVAVGLLASALCVAQDLSVDGSIVVDQVRYLQVVRSFRVPLTPVGA